MHKPYIISGIVGNSKMLGAIDKRGEIHRLWWPHIDYPQNLYTFMVGFRYYCEIKWFQQEGWNHSQSYEEDTPILVTSGKDDISDLKVTCWDFVLPQSDVMVRNYRLVNEGSEELPVNLVLFSSWQIDNTQSHNNVIFQTDSEVLLHYRHGKYFAIGSNLPVTGWQCGNAMESLNNNYLNLQDIAMSGDAALSWCAGNLPAGAELNFSIYLAAGSLPDEVTDAIETVKKQGFSTLKDETKQYWQQFIRSCRQVVTGHAKIDDVYKKTLIAFKLLSDREGGGILAAPEFDENYTRCGGYGYCWGRDGAFITIAMEKVGLGDLADNFFHWAIKAQNKDGSWHQRHYMSGELAPSWGLQIDETGAILWGFWQHFLATGNKKLLDKMYPCIKKAVEFLIGFIDHQTGLPTSCYDLWEERKGQHTYSAAAVYGGLMGAQEASRHLGDLELADRCNKAAIQLQKAIQEKCWSEQLQRFKRTVLQELKQCEYENYRQAGEEVFAENHPNGRIEYKLWADNTIDASLIGVSIPFNAVSADSLQMLSMVKWIEEKLWIPSVGGLKRYEHDNYVGGNPWIITTLWLALYYLKIGNVNKAKEFLIWSAEHATNLGFLPEQVDQYYGGPAWVIPLTWSHAMFVLVLDELLKLGETF